MFKLLQQGFLREAVSRKADHDQLTVKGQVFPHPPLRGTFPQGKAEYAIFSTVLFVLFYAVKNIFTNRIKALIYIGV